MKNLFHYLPITIGIMLFSFNSYLQNPNERPTKNPKEEKEIRRLYDLEQQFVLNQDTAGMAKFYPDDMVVTNPFNQYIDKAKVLERVKANIIKYSTYEKKYDDFRFYGKKMAIVVGSELVIPTQDAARTDAGKTVNRRFTEVWFKRGKEWKKVVRHANNVIPD